MSLSTVPVTRSVPSPRPFLTCSRTLSRQPGLAALLGAPVNYVSPACRSAEGQAVLAWGRKPSALKAEALAERLSLPVLRLEDGFIHSLGQGVLGAASCSLVLDQQGIYYDATRVSGLEALLVDDAAVEDSGLEHDGLARPGSDVGLMSAGLRVRAERLIRQIVDQHVSKYNNAPLSIEGLDLPPGKKVLLVDQTAGDMSLHYGLVGPDTAERMLAAALSEHPDAHILIKTHPDVIAGKKQGCIPVPADNPRVQQVSAPVNPLVLMREVDHVYVLTSQMGFEALLLGKPVTCFGMPFYAGWGLTDDRLERSVAAFSRRKRARSVAEVFAAAYLLYTRYIHPDTGEPCELEDVVEYVAVQHRHFHENAGHLFCFGFTRWKQNYIRRFLHAPGNRLVFVWKRSAALKRGFASQQPACRIVAWGERAMQEAVLLSAESGVPVWRIEDGFIRSVGLGSDYTPPLSLVLDQRGIYYDPTQPSDLEYLLQNAQFSPDLLQRANTVREMLLVNRLSKYNLGTQAVRERMNARAGQRIVLVPGQVEDDASIRKGCRDIASNGALLAAVRAANPDAFVIYKPHPDVVSGNRQGAVPAAVWQRCSDLVLDDASITDCLELADEVHTMTSLVGFEGLLRGKPVHCYGLPFYAGWGLTQDRHVVARRTRSLELNELVAATLILYPRYINWETGAFTTPEFAMDTLRRQIEAQGGKKKNKVNGLIRLWRKGLHLYHGVFTFRY